MQHNQKDHRAAKPRTGHGAASVIPHLNDLIPLEPAQLSDPLLEDSGREHVVPDERPAESPGELSGR